MLPAEISVQAADGSRERYPLLKDRITIGRSRDSDIFLPDQWLSRQHAEIRQKPDGYYVSDLGSKNGTLLNGGRLTEEQRLRAGDVITLGEHVLTFNLGGEPGDDEVESDSDPIGTRVFSARELSDIKTKPAIDATELARQNRVLGVLSRAAGSLVKHRSLDEIFEMVLDLLFEAVPAERGAILLRQADGPQLDIKAARSRAGKPITGVSRAIARRVLEQRVSILLPNVMEDEALAHQVSILGAGIRSAVCAPLWFTADLAGQDQVIGLVYLDTRAHTSSFTEDDLQIVTALANVAAAKIENVRLLEESIEKRRLEQDMKMAAEIQKGLLPGTAPTVEGYEVAGSNRPSRSVGGDYYDFSLDQGRLLFALGDVAGKGTGAALLMAVLRAAVRGHWAEGTGAEAMGRINRTVCQNVTEGKYVTFFLGRLDPPSGRVAYVNAGHNPPLLVRASGAVETLTEGGMVLGLFDTIPYAEGDAELRRGDTLLVFSDGITEAANAEGEEFGEARLAAVAVQRRELGAEALQAAILMELEGYAEGTRISDDRTLIVLKRR
jgi:serine phosphatase RsbU (regulator of sigma subunit)/pSer/pThr/pTyr-binding forkhead associated (FHA) protein